MAKYRRNQKVMFTPTSKQDCWGTSLEDGVCTYACTMPEGDYDKDAVGPMHILVTENGAVVDAFDDEISEID